MSKKRLKEAIDLLARVFSPSDRRWEPPEIELPASLDPARYKPFLDETKMSDGKYWLAIDNFGKVVGTIGLYCYESDKKEAFWIGWFCVNPQTRRQGIGAKLLQFSISEAEKGGKSFLRLRTSNHPNELAACRLYEKYGFRLTREILEEDGEKQLFYELKL